MEISEEALKLLSDQIKQQQRANDLKETELRVLRRREANVQQVLERYAGLGEEVRGLCSLIRELILTLHGQAEIVREIAERVERIDRANLLIISETVGKRTRLTPEQLLGTGPEVVNLKRVINGKQRRLHKLQQQQAGYGQDSPPHILTEIEDIETETFELLAQLRELEDEAD